jgi:nitrous oxidase accessory protein
MYSHHNTYDKNIFQSNESGVAVMYSRHVRMSGNIFKNSHGSSSYGLLLKDISDSFIGGNVFSRNTVGIFVDGTTRSDFEKNVFEDNGWAVKILGDTDSNRFTLNDFIGNTFDVATNAGINANLFQKNYWSNYRGLDLDRDGIGDEPYRPVRLTSILIQDDQASILLIHSLFFTMLDQIESALPLFTPETFKDAKPLMKRAVTP